MSHRPKFKVFVDGQPFLGDEWYGDTPEDVRYWIASWYKIAVERITVEQVK